jgi:hypothetical protein
MNMIPHITARKPAKKNPENGMIAEGRDMVRIVPRNRFTINVSTSAVKKSPDLYAFPADSNRPF